MAAKGFSKNAKNILDWDQVRRFISINKPLQVAAGIIGDWFSTCDVVWANGMYRPGHHALPYSDWAIPGFRALMPSGEMIEMAAWLLGDDEKMMDDELTFSKLYPSDNSHTLTTYAKNALDYAKAEDKTKVTTKAGAVYYVGTDQPIGLVLPKAQEPKVEVKFISGLSIPAKWGVTIKNDWGPNWGVTMGSAHSQTIEKKAEAKPVPQPPMKEITRRSFEVGDLPDE